MRTRLALLIGIVAIITALLAAGPLLNSRSQAAAPKDPLAPDIFASPIQAGCYIAAVNDCRIHVDPFTIDLTPGKRLVYFSLIAIQMPGGPQRIIYDWRPDQSNPAPAIGSTYSPSLVSQDFGATCGKNYEISLQGQDSGDTSGFNLGLTGVFTCPSTMP